MNFNDLMQKMRELDQPVVQAEACGDPMPPMPPMSSPMDAKPDTPPPSLSINLNAQGMDNIESIMKLMTKVNPDMINQPTSMPMSVPISISKPSTMGMGPLGNLDSGPLKMLPDLDSEPEGDHAEPDADNMGGPSDMDADNMPPMGDLDNDDNMTKAMGDIDGDGDHDMDDHEAEKEEPQDDKSDEDKEKKDEAYGNSVVGAADTEYKDVDYMVNKLAGGMNRQKGTYPKVAGGDNPMQRVESVDLKTSIKNELRSRLAEAKLAELSKDTLKSYKAKSDVAVGKAAAAEKDDGKFAKRFAGGEKAQAKLDKKGDE